MARTQYSEVSTQLVAEEVRHGLLLLTMGLMGVPAEGLATEILDQQLGALAFLDRVIAEEMERVLLEVPVVEEPEE